MKAYFCILFAATSVAAQAGDVQLQTPRGGWRVQDRSGEFMQAVHYPASRVNVAEGADLAAQLRGHIARQAKGKPATLVVNGNAMPLELDEAGLFARPYAFAAGSNSVQVQGSSGAPRRVQFLDAGQAARPRLRVLLSWDAPGTDLDLHVISPSGLHCYYGNRVIAGGAALDVDVTTGYGPEIFASARPERGVWQAYVNYYGGGRGYSVLTASISVVTDEGLSSETRHEYRVPLRSSGDLQHVASFSVR